MDIIIHHDYFKGTQKHKIETLSDAIELAKEVGCCHGKLLRIFGGIGRIESNTDKGIEIKYTNKLT